MQILKNDFSIVKRNSFQFYSLNLQLSSSESLYLICSDSNTAHRSTLLKLAEWMYIDVKKDRFQKAAVNLACLSERSSNTHQVLLWGTATHWWVKKLKRYKRLHTESINRSQLRSSTSAPSECTTMKSLLLISCKSHITNWCELAPFSTQKEKIISSKLNQFLQ